MPEPCNCLVALRLGIFFVLYPAVISYLWFYYIPTRRSRSSAARDRDPPPQVRGNIFHKQQNSPDAIDATLTSRSVA